MISCFDYFVYVCWDAPGLQCSDLYERTEATVGCHPRPNGCGRVVIDDFVDSKDVAHLRDIADKAMKNATMEGGPTIADINTGT